MLEQSGVLSSLWKSTRAEIRRNVPVAASDYAERDERAVREVREDMREHEAVLSLVIRNEVSGEDYVVGTVRDSSGSVAVVSRRLASLCGEVAEGFTAPPNGCGVGH